MTNESDGAGNGDGDGGHWRPLDSDDNGWWMWMWMWMYLCGGGSREGYMAWWRVGAAAGTCTETSEEWWGSMA